jgi:PAS domain S-box-containing protein
MTNITSPRNTEPAPDEFEQRFLQLAGNVEVGFMLRDLGSPSVLYASPSFNKVFGFDPAGPTPNFSDIRSRIHPDDLAAHADAVARADTGERVQSELRIVRSDGELRWIRFNGSPVMDARGTLVRVAATFEDVTERKNSEIALEESQGLLQRTADALQVGLALRQSNMPRFLFVSQKYIEIMGLDPDLGTEPTIESALQRVHPDDRDGVLADYMGLIETGASAQAELRIVQPSGDIRWLGVTSNPVVTEPGAPWLLAASVEDITARKVAEEALVSARHEAELANRAKDEFLSRMSHELRTPLNAVLGFAQLLELEVSSASQLDAIRHILLGGRHLLEMIDDLLDLSRIASDQFELSIEPVAVDELILETIGLLQPMAAVNEITIHLDPGHGTSDRYVLADRRRLRQVLLNLLSNAIKYNQRCGRVDIRCVPNTESQLTISMTDTGIGVRTEDIERMFSPFDRLGQQSTEIEGTGIGLALSQQLVISMGGRLEVASIFGRGSTLSVILPLTTARTLGGDHHTTAVDPGAGSHANSTATLLYIEDNHTNARLMRAVVGRRGNWTMIHAEDGHIGLSQALNLQPDLIFLDLHLPDMHGIDVLRALRADPITTDTPVVIVSADASPGQIERLQAAGALTYVTKPFDVTAVLRLLDQHVIDPP